MKTFTPLVILGIGLGLLAHSLPGPVSAAPATKPATRPATQPTVAERLASIDAKLAQVLAHTAPRPAAHPVYDSQPTLESLTRPSLKPLTWAHVAMYADTPTPRPDGPDRWTMRRIPLDNLRWFARTCRDGGVINNPWIPRQAVVAGAPVVLDLEGFYSPETVPLILDYVRAFRAEAPALKVGLYGVPFGGRLRLEDWRDGPTPAQLAGVRDDLAPYRPLIDACDLLVGGGYLYADEWLERDLAGYRRSNDELRALFPGKPLLFFVNPCFTHERAPTWRPADGSGNRVRKPLPPDVARRYLELAGRFDGTAMWADRLEDTRAVFWPLLTGK